MKPLDPSPADTQPNARPAPEAPAPSVRPSAVAAQLPAAPPPALTAPPGLESLSRALTHRLKFVLIFGLTALFLGAGVGWVLTPNRYIAQADLHLTNRVGRDGGNEDFLNFQRTQMTILKSHTILRKTLTIPDVADLREVLGNGDLDEQIAWLQRDLLVEPILGNAEVLRLYLSGRRPEDLANLLNRLMDVFVEDNRLKEQDRLKVRVKRAEDDHKAAGEELLAIRKQLVKKEFDNGVEDQKAIPEQIQRLEAERQPLASQKFQCEVDIAKGEFAVRNFRTSLEHPEKVPISETVLNRELNQNKRYLLLQEELSKLQGSLLQSLKVAPQTEAAQLQILEMYKPRFKDIEDQILPIREAIRQVLQKEKLDDIKTNLEMALVTQAVLQGQMAKINEKLDPLEVKINSLRDKTRGPGRLIPEVEALRDRVAQAEKDHSQKGQELLVLKGDFAAAGRIAIMESAPPPTEQKLDKKVKVAGMAGLSLFGLTFLGIAYSEFRARKVYTPDDVTRGLGIPIVGTLPLMPVGARRPLPGPDGAYLPDQGPLLESVDALRTVLLRASQTDGVRVVMVASAGGGEGKTSLATHLAASLARGWRNTLLIDADLRNPAAAAQFGLPDSPGLSEVLRGETTADEAIKPTTLARLAVLPAGRCDSYTLQALAQEEVGTILGHLKEDYDFIVIDVSPVLPVPDAMMIGQHCDAVILSVLRNVSRLPAVYAAQQRLASIDIPILGAVVIGERVNVYGINPYPLRVKN